MVKPERPKVISTPRILLQPGTSDWARSTIGLLRITYQSKLADEQEFTKLLGEIEQFEAWSVYPEEEPYGSLEELLRSELGVECKEEATANKKAQQMALDDDIKPQPKRAETMATKPRAEDGTFTKTGKSNGDIVTTGQEPRGNQAEYLVRRLKRDATDEEAPNHAQAKDALGRLASGELTSARAAAIAAGIVKVPTAVDLLKRAWLKATTEQRDEFLAWVMAQQSSSDEE